MKNLIFTLILSLLATNAMAEGFVLDLSASSGVGKTKNSTGSIANRSMFTHTVSATPAYALENFDLGLALSYAFRRQSTEPSEVANTNLRGRGFSSALSAKYRMEKISLKGELDFFGRYPLSNKDPVGQEITYKCVGICGIGLSASSPVWEKLEAMAGIRARRWTKVDLNSVENDISNSKLTEWSAFLGVSHTFQL